jgi:hypothetical protein
MANGGHPTPKPQPKPEGQQPGGSQTTPKPTSSR